MLINDLKKEIINLEERNSLFYEVFDSEGDKKHVTKIIEKNYKQIKSIEKKINKINNYKKIEYYYLDSTYDEKLFVVVFPKGTKREFKENWLYINNLPYYSERFKINSMYDCTNEITSIDVKYHGRKVFIRTRYDL